MSRQSGDEEPSCRIRCVSNTDIEVGPRDGGGATAADTGAIGSMGRGGGAGMGPSTGKGRGFFLGGGPDELASGRAPEELASRGVEAAEEETRGALLLLVEELDRHLRIPARARGCPGGPERGWSTKQKVSETRIKTKRGPSYRSNTLTNHRLHLVVWQRIGRSRGEFRIGPSQLGFRRSALRSSRKELR